MPAPVPVPRQVSPPAVPSVPAAVASPVFPAVPPPRVPAGPPRGRLFGSRRRQDLEGENARLLAELDRMRSAAQAAGGARAALERENAQMRTELERLRAMTGAEITARVEHSRRQLRAVEAEIAEAEQALRRRNGDLADVSAQIVETRETALLQESGIYEYRHRLEDSVAYKDSLDNLKQTMRSMVRDDLAVKATTEWSVNGSQSEGRAMVRDFSTLMLRAYNAEADNCVRTVRPHNRAAVVARLAKTRETIARLGRTMNIEIVEQYHRVRVSEIESTADYAAKVEEEKERMRAQREQQREEEKARKEFEREKARLLKERTHFESALAKVRERGGDVVELEARLASVDEAIAGVESREANVRAGYVYVISNVGAFGPEVVKIGLTRRLDPADRIRELGDASVPFRFDTHAIVFSEDAVSLETRLHQEFGERRVNQVNLRREFFRVTPTQVRDALARFAGQHLLEFHETPEALEWHASGRPA